MTINLKMPDVRELKPHIIVFGVGGAGGNAVNNMISAGLMGCEFVVANTDAQALASSKAKRVVQLGVEATQGLGAGSHPEVGRTAAEEALDELRDHLSGAHMAFITAGMGGGTGTGAAPVIARISKELGLLTVGVVTKPFHFEGQRRMRFAEAGIAELAKLVDTLIVIPNQNLFRVANEKTTFADAFSMADQVLYSGVACITDLMVKEGLINLDFADVRAVMREMGKAMMGTGEASGEKRAITAAEAAIANPLLDEVSMRGARGLLISITGGRDLTLYEVDEAATRIREEVDQEANIIVGATFDEGLDGIIRVSVVATGIDQIVAAQPHATIDSRLAELTQKLRSNTQRLNERHEQPQPAAAETAPPAATRPHPAKAAAPAPTLPPAGTIEDVTIRPLPPKPSLFIDAAENRAAPAVADSAQQAFVPPMPERPPVRPRMPRIEELPLPAQNQLRASRGDAPERASPEKRRTSLLQRLAAVGLGRREEDEEEVRPAEPRAAAPIPPRPAPAPRPIEPRAQAPDPVSEYAKRPQAPRPAPQGLDHHGRPAPVHNSIDEDQLEIPAFLRRGAN